MHPSPVRGAAYPTIYLSLPIPIPSSPEDSLQDPTAASSYHSPEDPASDSYFPEGTTAGSSATSSCHRGNSTPGYCGLCLFVHRQAHPGNTALQSHQGHTRAPRCHTASRPVAQVPRGPADVVTTQQGPASGHTPVGTGVHARAHSGTHTSAHVYTDTHRFSQFLTGLHRCSQMHTDAQGYAWVQAPRSSVPTLPCSLFQT